MFIPYRMYVNTLLPSSVMLSGRELVIPNYSLEGADEQIAGCVDRGTRGAI